MSVQEHLPNDGPFHDGGAPTNTEASQQDAAFNDAELQERYRKEYLLQLSRRSCPGCGEEPFA